MTSWPIQDVDYIGLLGDTNAVNINFCNEICFEKGNNTVCVSNSHLLSSQLLPFALSCTIFKMYVKVCHKVKC